jgi:hypothetical protein
VIEDLDDVRIAHAGSHAGLAGEALGGALAARGADELHRHVRVEAGVVGEPHAAHAARSELADELEARRDLASCAEALGGALVLDGDLRDMGGAAQEARERRRFARARGKLLALAHRSSLAQTAGLARARREC